MINQQLNATETTRNMSPTFGNSTTYHKWSGGFVTRCMVMNFENFCVNLKESKWKVVWISGKWMAHKRTIRVDAAFAMSWRDLMKLMTEVYCPRNEIQKMEYELWNLTVKNNDLAAYT
ncbi:hypothetical protein Tco_0593643 [Tanacetum coccineum]